MNIKKKHNNFKNIKSHIKIGDRVKVISGDHKGVLGTISSVVKKKSLVTIEGITPRVKYLAKQNGDDANSIKSKEIQYFIHVSNIMLWDKSINNSSRIGYKFVSNINETQQLKKFRYFKKSGTIIE
jgi:large subunit ribosomal protein L24